MTPEILAAAFVSGIIVKLTDRIGDKKIKNKSIKNFSALLGITYGFLTAYVILKSPIVASLWMAAVLGNILAGNIDSIGHRFGLFAMLAMLAMSGFPQFNAYSLALFVVASYADEVLKNLSDAKKIKNKTFAKIAPYRVLLETAAFITSLHTGQWILFISILFFDIGYVIAAKSGKLY